MNLQPTHTYRSNFAEVITDAAAAAPQGKRVARSGGHLSKKMQTGFVNRF